MSLESKLQEVSDTKAAVKKTVAYDRLAKLFDEGTMVEFDSLVKSEGGLAEVVTAYGTVDGLPAYAFAQNGDVTGGAISKAQARKIKKVYDFAAKTGAPVIGIYDSQGARLKQGGATQPTIVEMFCRLSPGGVVNDVWTLGKSADIVGASCFIRPGVRLEVSMTVAASVAVREGKTFFVVEQTGSTRRAPSWQCSPPTI